MTFLVFNLLRVQAEGDLEDGKQENEETKKEDETEEPEKLTDEVFTVKELFSTDYQSFLRIFKLNSIHALCLACNQ